VGVISRCQCWRVEYVTHMYVPVPGLAHGGAGNNLMLFMYPTVYTTVWAVYSWREGEMI
jgi:hypothetical protein